MGEDGHLRSAYYVLSSTVVASPNEVVLCYGGMRKR